MNKRIVHVLSSFPSKSETFIINLIVASINQGSEAKILADNISNIQNSSQPEILDEYNLFNEALSYNPILPKNKLKRILKALIILFINFRHYKVFLRSLNYKKFGNKSLTLKMWYQASIFLKFYETKIFHGHFGVSGIALAEMKEIGAIKGEIIVSFYGYDTFSTLENRNRLINDYRYLFKQSKIIFVNSKYLLRNLTLLSVPAYKVLLNHVGVDCSIFYYKERNQKSNLTLITVGRLIKLKGQSFALQVVHKLKELGVIVNLKLVGDGVEFENLKSDATSYGIESQVTFYGAKNQIAILDLFHKSDLFLMTSITDEFGRAEGQGLVTAEAQSTGLPALGFNSGGVPETILNGQTGFVVEEKDVDAMVEKIMMFANDRDLLQRLGLQASEFIKARFNNTIQSNKIVNIYEDILKESNG